MADQTRDPVAFVMSGGAAHGAIQVGMLAALFARGVVPDMITAGLADALNGAFITDGGRARKSDFVGRQPLLNRYSH